jgi:hypothetical protein
MGSDRKARLAEVNHWDELLALRDRQREQTKNGIQVIKESELPLEVGRQGLMRWYLHPAIKDTCLSMLLFFQQEIRPAAAPAGSNSGRQVMMITEGRGYTVIDGVKHPGRPATCSTCRCAPTASSCSTSTATRTAGKIVAAEPNWLEGLRSTAAAASSSWKTPEYRAMRRRKPMAEMERVRERERPPLKDNHTSASWQQRKGWRAQPHRPGGDRLHQQEWFQTRQGRLKYFSIP